METWGTIMEVRVIERVVSLTDRHRRVDVNVNLRSMSVMSPAVYVRVARQDEGLRDHHMSCPRPILVDLRPSMGCGQHKGAQSDTGRVPIV